MSSTAAARSSCVAAISTRPSLEARAEQVAEEICELRWASISELYRSEMLGEKEILPPGVIR
jgi:hypothetical protein